MKSVCVAILGWLRAWLVRLPGAVALLRGRIAKSRNLANSTGGRGEKVAAKHLKKLGYRILGRNLRNRFGEVDLLAEAPDRKTIVVVEVKSAKVHRVAEMSHGENASANDRGSREIRSSPRPEVHVNARKQYQLTALASQFARRFKLEDRPWRFDVIGVDLCDGQPPVIRHHEGAFESNL